VPLSITFYHSLSPTLLYYCLRLSSQRRLTCQAFNASRDLVGGGPKIRLNQVVDFI